VHKAKPTCTGIAAVLACSALSAQDKIDFTSLDLSELVKIDLLVVSASKQGQQRLQDIPMSITVIDQTRIEHAGIDDALDYMRTVPGLGFQIKSPAGGRDDTRSGRRLNLRGIESGYDSVPTTAFYLDDIPIPIMDPKLFDVARIEVLRGPQGALYGANSMGGTIRVVMNKPVQNEAQYASNLSVSSTEKGEENYALDGMINLPLQADKIAVRGVAFLREEGGFIDRWFESPPPANTLQVDRNINDERSWGTRLAADIEITPRFKIVPRIFHQDTRLKHAGSYEPGFKDLALFFLANVYEKQRDDFTLHSIEASYALTDRLQILFSTSYFDSGLDALEDGTKGFFDFGGPSFGTASYVNHIETKRKSQELRLAYAGSKWKGVFGAFYMDEDRLFDQFGDTVGTGVWFSFRQRNGEQQQAVFGEATYEVTDRFRVTAGARWFEGEQNQHTLYQLWLDQPPGMPFVSNSQGKASASSLSPKVQASYTLADSKMVYVSAAKGFRPGGPTTSVPESADCLPLLAELGLSRSPTEFEPDTLWNYEVGTKASFANKRLTVNAAAYHIDWKKVQQTVTLDCGFTFVGNVGAAQSQGVELEVWAQPVSSMDLAGSFGYTDAKFTRTNNQVGIVAGERFPLVPKITGSLSAQYSFALPSARTSFVRADYQYIASTLEGSFFDIDRPAYDSLDLRLGVNLVKTAQLTLFVNTVFDKRGVLTLFDNVFNQDTGGDIPAQFVRDATTVRPRTVGLTLRYRH